MSLKTAVKRSGLYERATALVRRRISYSQFGEDVHLRSVYDRLRFDRAIVPGRGLIVDIGGYRPILLSNTYYFYRQGWKTISIDPTPGSKRLFDAVRPRDVNLEAAVGVRDGRCTLFMFGDPSVWNTVDPDAAALAEAKTGVTPTRREVRTMRLDTVLAEHRGDLPFEIMSIDAEGVELEILQSADLGADGPRLILIEAHGLSLDSLPSHPVVRHLTGLGYRLFSWINPNLLFLRQDSALPR